MRSTWNILLLATLGIVGCGRGVEGPPLVLLISIDTLRADRLGAYGSELELTPRLDMLAAESTVFEAAYAPASFTVPSLSAVLTGRYPTQNAVYTNEHELPGSVATLATEMRALGYRTGAVVSNWVLRRGTGLERGFDRYDDRMRRREAVREGFRERVASATTDDALALLDELTPGDDPVFLWVHYQDPHGPYTPPEEYLGPQLERERARPGADNELPFAADYRGLGGIPTYQRIGNRREEAYYRAAYDAEVRFADAELGRLLDGVRKRGLWDDAIVAFLADHGEGLGEDDYWFAHGEYLSDSLVRVPLLVRVPGAPPERRPDVVGLVDLLPTLLARCGGAGRDALPGRDVLAAETVRDSRPVYLTTLGGSSLPRVGLVSGGFKYVASYDANGERASEQLFRLSADGEDLKRSDPAVLGRLRAELESLAERFRPEHAPRRRSMDTEDRRAMEALGYGGGDD